MSKKNNHRADIKNPNRGTSGTNTAWDKAQGNRGKQMNPTWTPPAPAPAPDGDDRGNQGSGPSGT